MNKPVNIWTGGRDSTFKLLDLVLDKKVEVQPYYLIDENRKSTQTDLNIVERI